MTKKQNATLGLLSEICMGMEGGGLGSIHGGHERHVERVIVKYNDLEIGYHLIISYHIISYHSYHLSPDPPINTRRARAQPFSCSLQLHLL
jgi:hypothetical protein